MSFFGNEGSILYPIWERKWVYCGLFGSKKGYDMLLFYENAYIIHDLETKGVYHAAYGNKRGYIMAFL